MGRCFVYSLYFRIVARCSKTCVGDAGGIDVCTLYHPVTDARARKRLQVHHRRLSDCGKSNVNQP